MAKLHSLWQLIRRYKYYVVLFFIVLIVGFLDDNSLMNYMQRNRHMNQIRTEIRNYQQQYAMADSTLRQLDRSPLALERIARERYMMKRPDEDVFVLQSQTPEQQSGDPDDSITITQQP